MRLFHISESKDIKRFLPRKPYRLDLLDSPPLVWAINEKCMVNFLTPRDCPRVTFHAKSSTRKEDIDQFFSSKDTLHALVIEQGWFRRMLNTRLYIYEFDSSHFYLQDSDAGYYVSEREEVPINVVEVKDIFEEINNRNVEFRMIPSLWDLREKVLKSSLTYSLCRMKNAEGAGEKL